MPRYVAAIDQGTTSSRCILFDRTGPVFSCQKEHRQILPRPGWVEHDPIEIWQRTQDVIAGALQQGNVQAGDIAAIGITNQRETTVVWDRETGRPFCNAIVWQDTRTKEICDALAQKGGQDRFRSIAGLPLATYFSGPKLKWILKNVPDVAPAAKANRALFGTIDTWIIWWLTGGPHGGNHVTDVTNASRTMLMNLGTLDWDPSMLEALGVPRSMLPRIISSSDASAYGTSNLDGPFAAKIPITGDLGDQQAALVGQVCFNPGESKNTYGTGCFMLMNTGTQPIQSKHGLLTTVAYRLGNSPAHYALEGSIAVTGSLVQWLRDQLGIIKTSAEVETLARTVDDNGGVFFVPAFSGLFAPHWRSDARGVIAGMTRHTDKGHIARAALEATAYQTREVIDAMHADSGVDLKILKVDGGMSVNELLMQFQSDLLNVPVVRSSIPETTALGAAYAAGLAVGFWRDLDDLRSAWRAGQSWQPAMPEANRASLYRNWLKAVDRSMNWIESEEL
jgi:glycerol kinase